VSAPGLTRRASLLAAAAAALLPARPAAAAAVAEPSAAQRFIQALGDRTVQALNRAGDDEAARVREMRAVLDSSVDVPAVARIVMGRSWRQASEAQRAEYLELFRRLTLGILAQRFSYYTGSERFVVAGARPAGGGDVMVRSQILYTDYPPLNVDWRVRRPEAEKPVIVDIVVEGVSLILTNRSEVDAIVGRRGIDGLLQELRARLERVGRGEAVPGSG
jgi:phospholipid transport system substrate-binding protein